MLRSVALASFSLLAVSLFTACERYEVIPSIYKQAAPKAPTVAVVPLPEPAARLVESARPEAVGPGPEEVVAPPTEPGSTERERDLQAELLAAYGSPQACLEPGNIEGEHTNMRLSVVVTASGRITRASASAPVPQGTRRCLRERAERLMLIGPIENAPRTISVNVRLSAPPAPPARPQGRVLPPGTVPAAQVLPARGEGSPDDSFVAPVRTLPAMVPAERPAGFVAPQSTLPPLGPTGSSRPIQDD